MFKLLPYILLSVLLFSCNTNNNNKHLTQTDLYSDGQIKIIDNQLMAWNKPYQNWLDIESFWFAYASRDGGITWGTSKIYPPYNQVKEFDTFLVELEQGKCLMEFYHSRWRRANDVRRWDEKHNQYGGCPYVFD